MRKIYFLFVVAVSLSLTQCAEEELFTEGGLATNIQLNSARTQDVRVPEITKVSADGSKVTIEFINYGSPSGPEGGFELMINEKRTYTNIIPRLYTSDKNVKMTFSISQPNNSYQIYARWNSGYKRSNTMELGSESTSSTPPSDDDSSDDGDSGSVERPSNITEPVISKLAIDGSKVTLDFVNFASPKQPEGGFELMVDGKRTGTSIIPRLYSGGKNLKMTFSISNPSDRCYQIYARWNSGYKGSERVCKEGGTSGESSPPTDDNSGDTGSGSDDNSGIPSGLPSLKLLRGYEFNSNFGSNVNVTRNGLKVHHLGHTKGKVVREGGEGAYEFRITPGSKRSKNYRQELVPRNLPSPYFRQGFRARWGQEYVYQMRVKISDDHQIGSDYTSFVSMKNDYKYRREGSYTMHIEGDHYFLRHMYATRSGASSSDATRKSYFYDANGQRLTPGKDYHASRRIGNGYADIVQGKWVTWTFYVRWTFNSRGFFKVYRNGKLFHSYTGPTSYKDEDAPYFKFGLYNSWWRSGHKTGSTLQEMHVDYVRIYVPK